MYVLIQICENIALITEQRDYIKLLDVARVLFFWNLDTFSMSPRVGHFPSVSLLYRRHSSGDTELFFSFTMVSRYLSRVEMYIASLYVETEEIK